MSDEQIETLRERCPCGASLNLEGGWATIRQVSERWRRDHKHVESAGICGAPAPPITWFGKEEQSSEHCVLRADHSGWHHGQSGDWSYGDQEAAGA